MNVEALNCPNCGAGVASDRTQCEFCKTRLKTVGCPSCFGLMFVGTQYCGHCGAKGMTAAVRDADDLGECPRCRKQLQILEVGDVELDECQKCGGMWAAVETFQKICADREEQSVLMGFIGRREVTAEPLSKISYVPCPTCKQLMNRSNFAQVSGVIIDVCKQHGVWFDAEELPKIIEFIQKGGMELARERERIDLQDARARLRAEQRGQSTEERRFGLGNAWNEDETNGIGGFIQKLFD